MMRNVAPGVALIVTVVMAACSGAADSSEAPIVETAGSCSDAHGAQVCTWTRMQGDAVVEAGATVPLAAIENAPGDAAMSWPPTASAIVDMPATAGGLTQLTMYWEPMGHAPATFMVPHFDFHFYRIPAAQRMAIDCSDVTKPAELPAAYSLPDEELPDEVAAMIGVKTLVGVCVPQMGMHSLVTEELAAETPFGGTMVIGYYQGEPIFFEPMISKALLLERRSFDLALPAVPGLNGGQPGAFRAEYIADQDAYRFVFSGFGAAT